MLVSDAPVAGSVTGGRQTGPVIGESSTVDHSGRRLRAALALVFLVLLTSAGCGGDRPLTGLGQGLLPALLVLVALPSALMVSTAAVPWVVVTAAVVAVAVAALIGAVMIAHRVPHADPVLTDNQRS